MIKQYLISLKNFLIYAHWCKGAWALDESNCSVYELSPRACKWCLDGAISYLFKNNNYMKFSILIKLRSKSFELYDTGLISLNDEKGFEAVHHVLDKAIEES